MVTRVKWRARWSRRRGAGWEAAGIPGTAGGTLVPRGEPSAALTPPGSATGSADTVAGPVDE